MINGIISVLVIFVFLGIGYFFTRTKKWPESTPQVFSTTVVQIAAPSMAITSIENKFTPELLKASVLNLIISAALVIILYYMGKALSHLLKLPPKKKAVFNTTFTFNNTMFIGLPIISIVFGDDGLPYLFTAYLISQIGRALV